MSKSNVGGLASSSNASCLPNLRLLDASYNDLNDTAFLADSTLLVLVDVLGEAIFNVPWSQKLQVIRAGGIGLSIPICFALKPFVAQVARDVILIDFSNNPLTGQISLQGFQDAGMIVNGNVAVPLAVYELVLDGTNIDAIEPVDARYYFPKLHTLSIRNIRGLSTGLVSTELNGCEGIIPAWSSGTGPVDRWPRGPAISRFWHNRRHYHQFDMPQRYFWGPGEPV